MLTSRSEMAMSCLRLQCRSCVYDILTRIKVPRRPSPEASVDGERLTAIHIIFLGRTKDVGIRFTPCGQRLHSVNNRLRFGSENGE